MTSIRLVQGPLLVVDRLERLAVAAAAHHDPSVRDAIRVIRVHRLAQLVHHVVRDVHHRR